MSSSCFEVKNISWHGILSDVSLELFFQENTFLVGPNGAGKTSLIKLLCGLEQSQIGEILWQGQRLQHLDSEKRADLMSYVPSESKISFPIKVLDFVIQSRLYKKRLWEGYSEQEVSNAQEILRSFKCESLSKRLCSTLSSGEWQRVMLARACHQNAKCLLLDEPQAHQDLRHQWTSLSFLKEWLTPEKALLIVSHDFNLALQFGDRLIALKDGQIFFDKTPDEIEEKDIQDLYDSKNLKIIDDDGRRLLAFRSI